MAAKRKYKTLTSKQTAKVRKYTKAGKSQKEIAKILGVAKQRVANAQKKAGVGKRVASTFWKQVKAYKEDLEISHKEATILVKNTKKWGTKRAARAGKKWKSYEERQADMRALRQEFEGEELGKAISQEMEDYLYGDTPK